MILNNPYLIFLCGFFGGVVGEILKWYRIRTRRKLPQYAKSYIYWVTTFVLAISGGILAVLFSSGTMNSIAAMNIGLSAPLIIESLSRTLGDQNRMTSNTDRKHSGSDIIQYIDESITAKVFRFLRE
jgi:hypothetical protein